MLETSNVLTTHLSSNLKWLRSRNHYRQVDVPAKLRLINFSLRQSRICSFEQIFSGTTKHALHDMQGLAILFALERSDDLYMKPELFQKKYQEMPDMDDQSIKDRLLEWRKALFGE